MRLALALFVALTFATPVSADPPDIHVDVPDGAKGMEVYVRQRDIAPGEKVGWHIHHGYEVAYVLSGEVNVQIAGGPIRHLVKGDTFEVERDVPHRAENDGKETASLLVTYIRDKAGPVSVPIAAPAVR